MPRLDIPEIHDRPWFPKNLRDLFTDELQFILNSARVYRPVADRLARAIRAAGAVRVIDLCSGGAGPWPWLHSVLREQSAAPVEVMLTDKYPNLAAFRHARRSSCGAVSFFGQSVDAGRIPPLLSGFRTVFSSIHHFRPETAQAILQDAADHRQGIAVFDVARRSAWTIAVTLAVPFAALAAVPFVRPFRLSRLFWTYVLPVLPAVLLIDGILSCLRAYTPEELGNLCARISAPGYSWEAGEARGLLGPVTYLIGHPGPSARIQPEPEIVRPALAVEPAAD